MGSLFPRLMTGLSPSGPLEKDTRQNKRSPGKPGLLFSERVTGIEPAPSAWKAEVLPLNYIRINWSGRRDSNSRPSPWQGDALPLSHFRIYICKIGRGRWIRTIESSANGFTVRPLWPLGNPSTTSFKLSISQRQYSPGYHIIDLYSFLKWSWRRESNPQPADYKSAALPLSHASILYIFIVIMS